LNAHAAESITYSRCRSKLHSANGSLLLSHFSFAFNFFRVAFCVTVLLTAKPAGMLQRNARQLFTCTLVDLSTRNGFACENDEIVNSGKLGHVRLIVCIPFVDALRGNYRLIKRTIDRLSLRSRVLWCTMAHAVALSVVLGTVRDSGNICFLILLIN
jgi:hypothetical protein